MNHYVYAMPQGRMTIVDSGGAVVRIGFGVLDVEGSALSPTALTNEAATQLMEYRTARRAAVPTLPRRWDGRRRSGPSAWRTTGTPSPSSSPAIASSDRRGIWSVMHTEPRSSAICWNSRA